MGAAVKYIVFISLFLVFISSLAENLTLPDSTYPNTIQARQAGEQAKLLPAPYVRRGTGSNNSLKYGQFVSVDGNRALVGALGLGLESRGKGAAYVYDWVNQEWQLTAILQSDDITNEDFFGGEVLLSGNLAFVNMTGGTTDLPGAVYVFEFDGQNWTQKQKIMAQGVVNSDNFGGSLSESGGQLMIGAWGTDSLKGSVFVFEYNGSEWQETQELTANDGVADDWFGYSVSVSGNFALVGAIRDDGQSGAAYVFEYDGSSWTQTDKLTASDMALNDWFGFTVNLSGNRAVIGASNDDSGRGSAYVFEFNGIDWIETRKLIADDGQSSDRFGVSVDQFGDFVLIGAPGYAIDSTLGGVYLFEYNGSDWNQTLTFTNSTGNLGNEFGNSVSFNADHVFISTLTGVIQNGVTGGVVVFNHGTGSWVEQTRLLPDPGVHDYDNFAQSLSISGNRALIGAPGNDDNGYNTGAAYLYDYDGQNWYQTTQLTATLGADYAAFGFAVSLSGDRALIGAPYDTENGLDTGAVYVFDFDGSHWNQTAKLIASDGATSDAFGYAVSLQGNRAVIGAYLDDDNGDGSGSVYVFDFDGSQWTEAPKITASDGAMGDWFGQSVSLHGDRILIGAYQDDTSAANAGSAYVFEWNGSIWSETEKLEANDAESDDFFGYSVSLSGDRALIGAYQEDDNGSQSGAAYVFDYDNNNSLWSQPIKLSADDGGANNYFGASVNVLGNRAMIGAPGGDTGSSYVFAFDGMNWSQSEKLTASDGTPNDFFGFSLSQTTEHTLVGAKLDDELGASSGSAYVYLNNDIIFADGFE
ncbi:MAG: hypothetical protein R3F25_04825 [Gammaproteobacteria bacterium]|jgi:hypothetical protein